MIELRDWLEGYSRGRDLQLQLNQAILNRLGALERGRGKHSSMESSVGPRAYYSLKEGQRWWVILPRETALRELHLRSVTESIATFYNFEGAIPTTYRLQDVEWVERAGS